MSRGNSRWRPMNYNFRGNRLPRKLQYGPKIWSDYCGFTYEGRSATDDFGNRYDTRRESPDIDPGPGALGGSRED